MKGLVQHLWLMVLAVCALLATAFGTFRAIASNLILSIAYGIYRIATIGSLLPNARQRRLALLALMFGVSAMIMGCTKQAPPPATPNPPANPTTTGCLEKTLSTDGMLARLGCRRSSTTTRTRMRIRGGGGGCSSGSCRA